MTISIIIGTLMLGFALRATPLIRHPGGLGVDHWFWKAYIEEYKKSRRFPPELPQYLFDQHQWYPPVFPLLIATVPRVLFEKYSGWIALSIDVVRQSLAMWVVNEISGGNLSAIAATGIIYAVTPMLISYNIQLNPRGLGALFLDILSILSVICYINPSMQLVALILVISGLILLTHKMTTQLFWFLCASAAFVLEDWRIILLFPGSIFAATIMSKGFYVKVLKAHWDIVTFWDRNWRWLQAHPVKESPVYGDPGYISPGKFHKPGWQGLQQHLIYLAGYLPALWIIIGLVTMKGLPVGIELTIVFWWLVLITVFSLATTFIPMLKCLGSGYLYLYNVAFPVAVLGGLLAASPFTFFEIFASAAILVLSFTAIARFYSNLEGNRTQRNDADLEELLSFLRDAPKGPVLCIPPQLYDIVAYKSKQPVLFGAHGFGFGLLEPVFPRLLISLSEIKSRYGLRHLVTVTGYLPETFKEELRGSTGKRFGRYIVYTWDESSG